MCGIAGILSNDPQYVSHQRIKSATDAIAHRGPEGEGFYINTNGTVALGHRRLSIIDLSTAAAQPMAYLNRYYITYNGELYNYVEIKKNLQQKGYTFYSESDTEVIVVAYAAYGKDCLQQFDGMFAFAIWDEAEQSLFAARDRFGEKPFFFYYDGPQLLFASEMKALWAAGISKEINPALLYNFLTIGYTANPADPQETFYQHISKLPAASYLHYSLPSHELRMEQYWWADTTINHTISEAAAIEQFQSLFSQSIQKRLRSDVAIGTSLSGGLDSSAIVAYCQEHTATQYSHKCFTAVFPQFQKNEESYARQIAKQFQLQHFRISITEEDLLQQMDAIAYHQEEPFGSASTIVQFAVYKAAKEQGVTVLLDGQGADEVAAGYTKYYKWYWQELYAQKKLSKSGEMKAAEQAGIRERFSWKNKLAALFPEFATAMLQSSKAKKAFQHPQLNKDFAFTHKQGLYYTTPTHFTLNGALHFNTFSYGLEELLRYADRNSMAYAVEVRLPFLNHSLVELLFSLPPHFKIHQGWTKWLLRKSVEHLLPSAITWRRDKVGFEPPQKTWMQHKAVQDRIHEGKKKLMQEGILQASVIQQKIQPQEAYAADNFDWRYWTASYLFTQ